VKNYFLNDYQLHRDGINTTLAKRQVYSKASRVTWFVEKFLDLHMVNESYGLVIMIMFLALDKVNDFMATSYYLYYNGLNGIPAMYSDWLTDQSHVFQTFFGINE
jgi:hypothetical protein